MKQVSIQTLKQHVSEYIKRAARGEPVLITKHNRPVALLSGVTDARTRVGSRVGTGAVVPLFRNATAGAYLEVLADDRAEE